MVFVDDTCIGCWICESMAWSIFKIDDWMSHVIKQPETDEEKTATKESIEACPVNAIKE